jgi:MarR family transcriptional regulator, organic hydroperoxide resistance regulator
MATTAASSRANRPRRELDAFVDAWDQFFAAIRHARGRAAQAQGSEITLSQHHLLGALAEDRELRIGELALAAGVTPPTATRMLDSLERGGMIKRASSPDDRRAVNVRLTAKGRRLLEAKRRLVTGKRRALYASLSPSERKQAVRLLNRLAEVIEEL